MRNTLLYFLAALVIFPVMAQQQPEWQSQYAVGLNKLAPHTYVWPYQTVSDIRNGDYESSPYYMSLNPITVRRIFINRSFIQEDGRIFRFPAIGNVKDMEQLFM